MPTIDKTRIMSAVNVFFVLSSSLGFISFGASADSTKISPPPGFTSAPAAPAQGLSTPKVSAIEKKSAVKISEPNACHGKSLKQKDCELTVGATRVRFWHDKVLLASAIGRFTESIPEQNEGVEWNLLAHRKIAKIDLVEFSFWSPPDAATGIATLNWYVYLVENGRAFLKLQKPIQKRVKTSSGHWRNDEPIAHEILLRGAKVVAKYGPETSPL